MTNVSTGTTTRSGMAAAATELTPKIVQVSLMYTYVHSIPEIKTDDVKLRFPYHQLTKTEDEPEYEQMCIVCEEIYRNALSIKSIFGGGNLGHKGSVTKPEIYQIDTGEDWIVPATGGFYPTFRANTTENAKKQTIAEFIYRGTNIKMSEVVEKQLKTSSSTPFPKHSS